MAEGHSGHGGDVEKIWKLMDKIDFCMLATREDGKIRSRPMAPYLEEDEDRIFFLTDSEDLKDDFINKDPNVGLTFADGGKFVSLSGRAAIRNDRAKIKELWNVAAKAWFDGPDDPRIRVIEVTPDDAKYWETPGKVVATISMAAAAVSDTKPKVGKSGEADL